jgi:protocatechuate 3,4-dioxygenase beta subunit
MIVIGRCVSRPPVGGASEDPMVTLSLRWLLASALSSLFGSTTLLAASEELEPTRPTGIGVWYQPGAPPVATLWHAGDPGQRLNLEFRIRGSGGESVAGAQVEIWQADGAGTVHADRYRTTLHAAADGTLRISTALPDYVWRARHIHYVVEHPDYQQLITRVFFKGDPVLAEYPEPGLDIVLEEARLDGGTVLFGAVEVVLRRR